MLVRTTSCRQCNADPLVSTPQCQSISLPVGATDGHHGTAKGHSCGRQRTSTLSAVGTPIGLVRHVLNWSVWDKRQKDQQ